MHCQAPINIKILHILHTLTDFNCMKIFLKTILELNGSPTCVFVACSTIAQTLHYKIIYTYAYIYIHSLKKKIRRMCFQKYESRYIKLEILLEKLASIVGLACQQYSKLLFFWEISYAIEVVIPKVAVNNILFSQKNILFSSSFVTLKIFLYLLTQYLRRIIDFIDCQKIIKTC